MKRESAKKHSLFIIKKLKWSTDKQKTIYHYNVVVY